MNNEALQSVADLVSPGRLLAAAVLLGSTWLLLRLVYWATEALALRFHKYRLQIARIFPLTRLVAWHLAAYLVIVFVFRPPATTVLALLASAGLAVGLASQDLLKNVIAGIVLLFDQPFRVGDMVQIGDDYGEVTGIGLRSVRLQTFDDSTVSLPNAYVLAQAVSNSNAGALEAMVVVEFWVPATAPVQQVRELAWEAAACSPYVCLKKPIAVVVEDRFDRTFLTAVKVKAYVQDVRLERVLASDITQRLKKALVERGLLSEAMVLGTLAGTAA